MWAGRRAIVFRSAEQNDSPRVLAPRRLRTDAVGEAVIDAVKRAEVDEKHKPLEDFLL